MRKNSRFSSIIALLLSLTLVISCTSTLAFAEDIVTDDENVASLNEDTDLIDDEEEEEEPIVPTGDKTAPANFKYSLYGKDSAMKADFTWEGSANSYIVRTWVSATTPYSVPSEGYVDVTSKKRKATAAGLSNYNTNWFAIAAVYDAATEGAEPTIVWTSPQKMDNYTFPAIQASDITVKKLYSDDNKVTVTWKTGATSGYYQLAYGTKADSSSMTAFGTSVPATDMTATANIPKDGTLYVSVNICANENSNVYIPTGTVSTGTVKLAKFANAVKGISWYSHAKSTTTVYSSAVGGKSIGKVKKGAKLVVVGKYPAHIEKWYDPKMVQIEFGDTKGWIPYKQCSGGVKAKVSKVDYSRTVKEDYINSLELTSKTSYLLWASPYTQRVYLFRKSNGEWKLSKINGKTSARITSGKFQNPTAAGTYEIHTKKSIVYQFTLDGIGYYYKYASYFNGRNSFHTGCYFTDTGGAKNSVKASFQPNTMGCIRMYTSDALWIYNNVPMKTTVKTTRKA